ncbi:interferon gamma receptor 1-like [Festucalex cinctus]
MEWTCLNRLLVIFFILGNTSAYVAPPSDVTLHCGNLVNKVEWRYDNPPPGLRFRVDVYKRSDSPGDLSPVWVDPPDMQADVSFLSNRMEDYFLQVTAVLGEEKSEAADSSSFSYYMNSAAAQKCSLDLPPVTMLKQDDDSVLISFQHPWLAYQPAFDSVGKRNRRHERLDKPLPLFKYDVILDKEQFHSLRCTEDVCERKLPVDAGRQEHCAVINGELERISVHGTQDYCARPVQGTKRLVIIAVVSVLVLVVIAAIFFMLFRKKTNASSELPGALRFDGVVETAVASVTTSDSSAPLMVVDESASPGESQPSDEPEPSGEDDEVEEEEQQAYMGGEHMDADEDTEGDEDSHGYEKRRVVVSLSQGEDVEGYRD